MTNTCLFCHKPVTDDIKRLPMLDGSGQVTEKLVHRACHERLMALRRVMGRWWVYEQNQD